MADKSLVMSFLDEGGKKATVRLDGVKADLTEAQITTAMDVIIAKNIFHNTGGDLKTKDGAQIVEKSVKKMDIK